jgi:tocopherol cyclase
VGRAVLHAYRNLFRPEAYHGHGRRPPFFEGWYFKLVDALEQRCFAVIPGVYAATDPAQSHAFVQLFDGARGRAWYVRYPYDAFRAHPRRFEVELGPNRFGRAGLSLDLPLEPGLRCQGRVGFDGVVGWPVTLRSPGVMGWFAYVPIMECYHGVVGLDHGLHGSLSLGPDHVALLGGRGYIEKDWGQSFPRAWVWVQSNHFDEPGVCLTASVALIPNLGRVFPGFIVGLWRRGQLHRFATYTGATIESLRVDEHRVQWVMADRRHRLVLAAHRAPTTVLPGPTIEGMERSVHETLRAAVDVRLEDRARGRVLFEGRGRSAGLEVMGDVARLGR